MGTLGRGKEKYVPGRGIKGVAFDLDGTIYPDYRLFLRILPSLLVRPRFFCTFGLVRRRLHSKIRLDAPEPPNGHFPGGTFYDRQASLMCSILGGNPENIKEKTERLIYRGWADYFSRIRLFPGVRETLEAFRRAGLKLGVLSDFPPRRKLSLLGLESFFDAALGAEETGFLKPHGVPFAALARALALAPGEILYVGNSPRYDGAGALAAGMKAALIRRSFFSTGRFRPPEDPEPPGPVDFIFQNYRQLRNYVLG